MYSSRPYERKENWRLKRQGTWDTGGGGRGGGDGSGGEGEGRNVVCVMNLHLEHYKAPNDARETAANE